MKELLRTNGAALAALAVLAAVAVFTQRHEANTIDTFASDDYASGGYRAYAVLLAREGLRTGAFIQRPAELGPAVDTLVSAQPLAFAPVAARRTAAEIVDLAQWVRAGGNLVYIGRTAGMRDLERTRLDLPPVSDVRAPHGAPAGLFAARTGALEGAGTLRIATVPRVDLRVLYGDGSGAIAVRYPLGRGSVIAVTDPHPFTNGAIARAGNARLAYLIAQPRRTGGAVLFDEAVHGEIRDRPWYGALTAGERLALAIAAIAVAFGVIGGLLRGGPAVRLEPVREPTSAEFIAALAALRARIGARSETRDALAAALAHDAALAAANVSTDDALLASARLACERRKEELHGRGSDRRREAFGRRARASRRRE